jgi:ABC-type Na+ transport system ATPase subunit NatA
MFGKLLLEKTTLLENLNKTIKTMQANITVCSIDLNKTRAESNARGEMLEEMEIENEEVESVVINYKTKLSQCRLNLRKKRKLIKKIKFSKNANKRLEKLKKSYEDFVNKTSKIVNNNNNTV